MTVHADLLERGQPSVLPLLRAQSMAAASVDFASNSVTPDSSCPPRGSEIGYPTTVPEANDDKPERETAVCPFCSLLCDDLRVRRGGDQGLKITRNGCRRAEAGFARAPLEPTALVQGEAVSLDTAITAAARLLKRAQQPLFAGLATDVDGMRAGIGLAERCGAIIDHLHGDALASMSRLLQTRGWYATTLSEVRNRADLVLVVDVDMRQRYENFPRRCLKPGARLRPGRGSAREVVFIGDPAHRAPALEADRTLACRGGVEPVLHALLARLRGHPLSARRIGGVNATELDALAERVRAAEYCAVVFAPGMLGDEREPVGAAICDLVDEINRERRGALLALGGDDGGQSAVATAAWLTGYPLRTAFGRTLEYDPLAYRTQTLLADPAVDALLWIDAYGTQPAPPGEAPRDCVVLGAQMPPNAAELGVFIAVGTPGLDHAARLVRTDTVVTLPLSAQRDSGLPSVAGVITRMLDRI